MENGNRGGWERGLPTYDPRHVPREAELPLPRREIQVPPQHTLILTPAHGLFLMRGIWALEGMGSERGSREEGIEDCIFLQFC